MAERGEAGELDVIELDDAPPPPDINAPIRRLLVPLRRWWWAVAAVFVVSAALVGAYVAVAVTGVRQVESTWHAALSLRDRYDEHLAATFRTRTEFVRVAHPEETVKEAARTYAARWKACWARSPTCERWTPLCAGRGTR